MDFANCLPPEHHHTCFFSIATQILVHLLAQRANLGLLYECTSNTFTNKRLTLIRRTAPCPLQGCCVKHTIYTCLPIGVNDSVETREFKGGNLRKRLKNACSSSSSPPTQDATYDSKAVVACRSSLTSPHDSGLPQHCHQLLSATEL